MRSTRGWILIASLALGLSACGNSADEEASPDLPGAAEQRSLDAARIAEDAGVDPGDAAVSDAAALVAGPASPGVAEPGLPDLPVVAEVLSAAGAAEQPAEIVPAPDPVDGPPPDGVAPADPEPLEARAADAGEPPPAVDAAPLLTARDDADLYARLAEADAEAGWRYVQRCAGCHSLATDGDGPGQSELAPALAGIVGRGIGAVEGFAYSPAFDALRATGTLWDPALLDAFLANPTAAVPGTTMDRSGIQNPDDRANVIAFLVELGEAMALAESPDNEADIFNRLAAADIVRGEALATQLCGACHTFDPDGGNLVGPTLVDVVEKPIGGDPNFAYSPALRDLNARGETWTYAFLDEYLASPAQAVPGTRMGFSGLRTAADRASVIAFLRQLAPDPAPLDVAIGIAVPGMTPVAFAADQADRGQVNYTVFLCEECHAPDLRGDIDTSRFGEAPALVGPTFERRWFGRDVDALLSYLENHRRSELGGDPDEAGLRDVIAFILQRNGFRAGVEELAEGREALEIMGFFQ